MSPELDKQLCEKYPKIFRDRHAPMTQTCMCWGLEVGNGWANLIDGACALVQHHVTSSRKNRATAIQYNRALKRALENNDLAGLEWFFTFGKDAGEWAKKQVAHEMLSPKYRPVPNSIDQLIATQVKEKFGTLSFYYFGGDGYCDGVIRMAEYMSGCTCEVCGKPGKSNRDGWIKVRCPDCFKTAE